MAQYIVPPSRIQLSSQYMQGRKVPKLAMDTKDIFSPEGGFTPEAILACKANGINPSELHAQTLESFQESGVSQEGAQTLFAANKRKRAGLINLVKKHIQQHRIQSALVDSPPRNRAKIQKILVETNKLQLDNLSKTKEERFLQTVTPLDSAFLKASRRANTMATSTNKATFKLTSMSPDAFAKESITSVVETSQERKQNIEQKLQRTLINKEMRETLKQQKLKEYVQRDFNMEKERTKIESERLAERKYKLDNKQAHFSEVRERKQAIDKSMNAQQKASDIEFTNKSIRLEKLRRRNHSSMNTSQVIDKRNSSAMQVGQGQDELVETGSNEGGDYYGSFDFNSPTSRANFERQQRLDQTLQIKRERAQIGTILVNIEQDHERKERKRTQINQEKATFIKENFIDPVYTHINNHKDNQEYEFQKTQHDFMMRSFQLQQKQTKFKQENEIKLQYDITEKKKKFNEQQMRVQEEVKAKEQQRKALDRKVQLAKKKIEAWKKEQKQAAVEGQALSQQIASENNRVKQLNMQRCKRIEKEYKMHLVQQMYQSKQRQDELHLTKEQQKEKAYRQGKNLRDQVISTAQTVRQLREPVGIDARYKEYLMDERMKRKSKMMQS